MPQLQDAQNRDPQAQAKALQQSGPQGNPAQAALTDQVKNAGNYAAQKQVVSPDGAGAAQAQPGDVVNGWVVYETEARRGGSLAWRNNNPGNIRNGSFAESHGAYAGKSSSGFAVFPTYEQGAAAIVELLKTPTYSGKTIAKAISTYAPSSDNNDPVAYAAHVERATGLQADTVMNTLTDDQLAAVAKAIEKQEGSIVGTTLPRTDATLPAKVRLQQ